MGPPDLSPPDEEDLPHIPGSGIEFGAIGALHVIEPAQVLRRAVAREHRGGLRLAPAERLKWVEGSFEVGDLVVTAQGERDRGRTGRPMQVVAVDRGECLVLDDPSLGRPRSGVLANLLASRYIEPAMIWLVLDAWCVTRCPRCHSPGLIVLYGMVMGPAGRGRTLGGCVVTPMSGNACCSRCDATWADGRSPLLEP
jgi:hypothetical protein